MGVAPTKNVFQLYDLENMTYPECKNLVDEDKEKYKSKTNNKEWIK